MKRFTYKQRLRQQRILKRKFYRRQIRFLKKRQYLAETGQYELIPLFLPRDSDLHGNSENFLKFINEIRNIVYHNKRRCMIRFDNCDSISDEAAIVLAAEVQRLEQFCYGGGKRPITGNYPSNQAIFSKLSLLGFFEHLKIHAPIRSLSQTQKYIQIKSGIRVKASLIEALYNLVFENKFLLKAQIRKDLYRGLSEAMQNVANHAYEDLPGHQFSVPVIRGTWWMSCFRDDHERTFGAYFYDQGVGIPATVPFRHGTWLADAIAKLGIGNADADMIQAAMEIGRSKTNLSNRGKGMLDLKRILDDNLGELRITSGLGRYRISNLGDGPKEELSTSTVKLNGTLISWKIQLSDDAEDRLTL